MQFLIAQQTKQRIQQILNFNWLQLAKQHINNDVSTIIYNTFLEHIQQQKNLMLSFQQQIPSEAYQSSTLSNFSLIQDAKQNNQNFEQNITKLYNSPTKKRHNNDHRTSIKQQRILKMINLNQSNVSTNQSSQQEKQYMYADNKVIQQQQKVIKSLQKMIQQLKYQNSLIKEDNIQLKLQLGKSQKSQLLTQSNLTLKNIQFLSEKQNNKNLEKRCKFIESKQTQQIQELKRQFKYEQYKNISVLKEIINLQNKLDFIQNQQKGHQNHSINRQYATSKNILSSFKRQGIFIRNIKSTNKQIDEERQCPLMNQKIEQQVKRQLQLIKMTTRNIQLKNKCQLQNLNIELTLSKNRILELESYNKRKSQQIREKDSLINKLILKGNNLKK